MNVTAINNIPQLFDWWLQNPQQRLEILQQPTAPAGSPQGMDGTALPADSFIPKRGAGVYGVDGRLRAVSGAGCSFLAYA